MMQRQQGFLDGLRCACAVAALTLPAMGLSQATAPPDPRSNWFSPSLRHAAHPVCSTVLDEVKALFYTGESLSSIVGPYYPRRAELAGLRGIDLVELARSAAFSSDAGAAASAASAAAIQVREKPFYLSESRYHGCGGGCEAVSLTLSEAPRESGYVQYRSGISDREGPLTPKARSYQLYVTQDGDYFAAIEVDRSLRLYEPTSDGTWSLACDVAWAPDEATLHKEARAQASLHALRTATERIRGDTGASCGSLRSHELRSGEMARALQATLYRPWADPAPPGEDAPYATDARNLERWSYGGVLEHAAFADFQAQLRKSAADLAAFYVQKNAWSPASAQSVAQAALKNALSVGIRFYEYRPFDPAEAALREAILENASLREIQQRPLVLATLNVPGKDSLLNLALHRPEILAYLLRQGLDPNQPNAFGKTPLMYAAQYDQLPAVELLIEAGAHVNAVTRRPEDDCYYALGTTNVTALHYAVRYASGALIERLLDAGALAFIEAVGSAPARGPYPLDWLTFYANPSSEEPNPHLASEDLLPLRDRLRVPNMQVRDALAADLVLRAEADYARGDAAAAYRSLRDALHANPENQRAVRDMSLIALRAGRTGEALNASARLRKSSDPRAQAEGWFNYGLACEATTERFYDGAYHCAQSLVHYALRAWQLRPSDAAKERLARLFEEGCRGEGAQRYVFAYEDATEDGRRNPLQRVYVMHPQSQSIDAAAISWTINVSEQGRSVEKPLHPEPIERHELDDFAVTVLQAQHPVRYPVRVGPRVCARSKA